MAIIRERYRLVKEMRLEGISSIDHANAWINGFVEFYNARFSEPPSLPFNVHQQVMDYESLDDAMAEIRAEKSVMGYDSAKFGRYRNCHPPIYQLNNDHSAPAHRGPQV